MHISAEQLSFELPSNRGINAEYARAFFGSESRDAIIIVVRELNFGPFNLVEETKSRLQNFNIISEKLFLPHSDINDSTPVVGEWAFAVKCKGIERCRDILKQFLFEFHLKQNSSKPFRLSDYLEFCPPSTKANAELVEHTFVHGEGRFYRFLFSCKKFMAENPVALEFLTRLPQDCPNHLFFSGPKASKGRWSFPTSVENEGRGEVSRLAVLASNAKLMKRAHENLERYFILNDPRTFACEIPVWLQPSDFQDYSNRFGTTRCITGHIDVLRLEENGRIGVWDYKPNAANEKTAAQQLWFYMTMVSKRMGVPLDRIEGGYFDEEHALSVRLQSERA